MAQILDTSPLTRLFTIDEYCRMSDLGILLPEERTELIDGEVVTMAAQNPPHVSCTQRGYDYLTDLFRSRAHVRMQAPILISRRSMPEPDLALVHLPREEYDLRHPKVNDVYLVIEVSDATLNYDLGRKAKMYAKAGITNYWVIDAIKKEIHQHQNPCDGQYGNVTKFQQDAVLTLADFSDFSIEIARLFPRLNT